MGTLQSSNEVHQEGLGEASRGGGRCHEEGYPLLPSGGCQEEAWQPPQHHQADEAPCLHHPWHRADPSCWPLQGAACSSSSSLSLAFCSSLAHTLSTVCHSAECRSPT